MAVRKDPEGWGGPRREQGLFEQAQWPRGSWQECLEQGGEHSGGLKRKLEPGMGALSLAAWRNKKRVRSAPLWSMPFLRVRPSPPHPSLSSRSIRATRQNRGSTPHHSEPPALLPGLLPWALSLKNISGSGARAPSSHLSRGAQRDGPTSIPSRT